MNKNSTDEVPEEHAKGHNLGFTARLRGYLIAGILVTAPISITIYLTWVFLTFVDNRVTKILPEPWYSGFYGETTIPGLGLIVALVFFVIVGWFATNFLGRLFIRLAEYVVHRVPIINIVYKAVKQVFETVMSPQAQAFREVVMFEFPRKDVWAMGFVTGVTKGEVQRLTADEVVNVFYPTTPNPTSGFLIFVPKKDLVFLKMSVDEAIKMIISGGILTPPDPDITGPENIAKSSRTSKNLH